jgi:hypothetical protein
VAETQVLGKEGEEKDTRERRDGEPEATGSQRVEWAHTY